MIDQDMTNLVENWFSDNSMKIPSSTPRACIDGKNSMLFGKARRKHLSSKKCIGPMQYLPKKSAMAS